LATSFQSIIHPRVGYPHSSEPLLSTCIKPLTTHLNTSLGYLPSKHWLMAIPFHPSTVLAKTLFQS
jgi:hypothetical protein